MTIKEIAKLHGITTQAVYAKIKAAGLDLSAIREGKTAQLTPEGLEAVRNLFAKKTRKEERKEGDLIAKIGALQVENKQLKEQIEELRIDRDRWAKQAEDAQKAASNTQEALLRAQAINMANIKVMESMQPRTLWQRLTGRRPKALEQQIKDIAAEEGSQGGQDRREP